MNVNIPKYLQGGSALPFVDYMPFTGVDTSVASSTTESSKSNDNQSLGLKDLLNLAKEVKGLPSDISKITQSIEQMYAGTSLFDDGKLSDQRIVTTYLSTLQKIRVAEFNSEQFKNAQTIVEKNGGLNEIAIDENGRLIVQDTNTGAMNRLTVEQFNQLQAEDPNRFKALTNFNLLDCRAQNNHFAFSNDILRTISNGIGEKTVTEMLQRALNDIGTTTLKQEGYSEKAANRIKGGISLMEQAFEQGMTVDGLYKQSMLSKDQKEQISAAMNYLWNVMPENARTWLKYKSGSNNPTEGAKSLMQTLMFAHNSPTTELDLDLTKNPDESSDESSDDGKLKTSYLGNLQAGSNGREATFHVNLGGKYANSKMSITGTAYGLTVTPDGKPIGPTSMYNMLQQSRIFGISDDNNIFFGEQKVSVDQLKNIAYKGDQVLRVNIPCKADGTPDFDLLKSFTEAQQKIRLSGGTLAEQKAIIEEYPELAGLVNSDGSYNMNRFKPYLIVNAMTTDKLAGVNLDENNYVSEVSPDPNLYAELKESLATGTGKDKQYPDIDEYGWSESIFKGWGEWINGYDHIVKGYMFIPLNMNRGAASMYANQHISQSANDSLEEEYQQSEAFLNYNKNGNSSSLLLND